MLKLMLFRQRLAGIVIHVPTREDKSASKILIGWGSMQSCLPLLLTA